MNAHGLRQKKSFQDLWSRKQLAWVSPHYISTCSLTILSFTRGRRAAPGEGRPPPLPIAPRKPAILLLREVRRAHHPAKSARISPSPSRITTPRRIGPKEGGHQEAGLSKEGGGDLSPIRGTDGAISAEGAVAAWARAPGTRAAPDGGGGQKRWVGAKVARCGEGSIRRAFAFAESVIVCRFFYKDWTTII